MPVNKKLLAGPFGRTEGDGLKQTEKKKEGGEETKSKAPRKGRRVQDWTGQWHYLDR